MASRSPARKLCRSHSTLVEYERGHRLAPLDVVEAYEAELRVAPGTLVALHLGRKKDDGTLLPEQVSMGKMGNVRGAIEVCRTARTILGGNGITLEYPVIRHMNNLESVLTYEGTHEVHTLVVGEALTGENAFR